MEIREEKGKSLISFPSEYVVLDVETTGLDFEYDELIEVSALKVENDEIKDSFTSLIKPSNSHVFLTPEIARNMGYDDLKNVPYEVMKEFSSTHIIPEEITDLTGITDEMILEAPGSEKVIPKLLDFIGSLPIIGHNINFDVNFIFDESKKFGITFSNNFIDTLRISRKLYPDMKHHRLIDIAERLNVNNQVHHRALDDASTTFECYIKMKKEIINTQGIDNFRKSFHKGLLYENSLKKVEPSISESEIDDTNPIYQKTIVFTGELSSMKRKDAYQIVLNLGGIPQNTITKDTNILVVGNEEFSNSVKNGKTTKMQKAEKYAQKGIDIITLSESTFFSMISDFYSTESN